MRRRRGRFGFTLIEAMLSMLIFVVGLVAVASLFPVSARLQRQAADDVLSEQVASAAKAMLRMRGIDEAVLINGLPPTYATDNVVHPLPPEMLREGDSTSYPRETRWTINDRSYPHTVTLEERDAYWVPMVRLDPGSNLTSTSDDQWFVYTFSLRHRPRQTFDPAPSDSANPDDPPTVQVVKVENIIRVDINTFRSQELADMVTTGDMILDEFGTIYRVGTVADDEVNVLGVILNDQVSAVWTARPMAPGERGPSLRIEAFSGSLVPVVK